MPERNKTIFISDIHLGDQRSWEATPHPYSWCMDNIGKLGNFLTEKQKDASVKELVILGDFFDTWIIPADFSPLTSFDEICSNPQNKPIIDNLKDQKGWSKIPISYVLGNHDMAISPADISTTQQYMQKNFPHIKCLFKKDDPLGKYERGLLLAEHGNRYGLFNGPDNLTNPASFLPIGYFISRIVGTKELKTGKGEDICKIAGEFVGQLVYRLTLHLPIPNFVEGLLRAIAKDAKFKSSDKIDLTGLPGYNPMDVPSVGKRFGNLLESWSGIDKINAVWSDIGNLFPAASSQNMKGKKVVIFGHTHKPEMYYPPKDLSGEGPVSGIPSQWIYANCGSWVDKSPGLFKEQELGGYGRECSYVETEEVRDDHKKELRIYVRVKTFPDHKIIDEGFVREII